jgi:hypothetical protein
MKKVKFIIYGLRNHKLKFMLIFITTFITILTFNISSSFQKSVIDTRYADFRDLTLNSQIFISTADGQYGFFDPGIIDVIDKQENVQASLIRCIGYINSDISRELLCLLGMDIEEQRPVYDIEVISGDINNFRENDIIVSEDFAKKHGLGIGSKFYVYYGDKKESLNVKAIGAKEGFFENTIGVTKKDILKIGVFEGLTISLYSSLCGMIYQRLILSIVTDILSFYVGKIDVAITYKSIIAMFLISSMLIISVLIGVIKKYVLKVNLIERVISY